MEPLVVRRSAWRMWGLAVAGIPLVVIATDVLTHRRISNALREILFRPEDTQLFEPRDLIWAWAMLAVGLGVTVFGLKELIFPTAVLRADAGGLALKVTGPFRGHSLLPWEAIDDIGSATIEDEGDRLIVFWIRGMTRDVFPPQPWGARWVDERTLALLASDWERTPAETARAVTDYALAVARLKAGQEAPEA